MGVGVSTELQTSGLSDYRNDAFSFWKLPEAWRGALGSRLASSEATAEWYLLEKYANNEANSALLLTAYYALRQVIPARMRHFINSAVMRIRGRPSFPRWPQEDSLLLYWRDWLRASLSALGVSDGWHVGFWPEDAKCCTVLTHDIESPAGFALMRAMADIEYKYGFRSAWNIPLAQYHIDWDQVEELRAEGFEFGAHGLAHDGKLFRSYTHFSTLAPQLESLALEHNLRGFRSPSTLRSVDWISTMNFDFDSTFADTDPYEVQPGGTCSVFPFFLRGMIELPYTLPQDHTLMNVLHMDPLPMWREKLRWITSVGGMILTLVHPDYCGTSSHLHKYEELLKELRDLDSSWRALPSQVAAWWRRRSQLRLAVTGEHPIINGPDTTGAVARRLSSEPILNY